MYRGTSETYRQYTGVHIKHRNTSVLKCRKTSFLKIYLQNNQILLQLAASWFPKQVKFEH